MPPTDTSPPAVVRYLTRLLTALTIEKGGELRIPLKLIRQVELESSRQMLVEDTDTQKDQLVLRFGTKHSAVYPVEPECPSNQQPRPSVPVTATTQPASATLSPTRRLPKTPEELLVLERNLRARRAQATLAREKEQQQRDLSDILGPNSTS